MFHQNTLPAEQFPIIRVIHCKFIAVELDFTGVDNMIVPLNQQVNLRIVGLTPQNPGRLC